MMARDLELGCSDERGLDALQAHDHLAIAHKGDILTLWLVKGNLADATTRRVDVLIELVNAGVFDVDDHQIVIDHIVKQFDLGKRIVLMALMPAQVVGSDVEQHRHARVELGGRSNLIARELSHKPLVVGSAVNLVDRRLTDVADSYTGLTGSLEQIIGQRRGGRLAVGARDGNPVIGRQAIGKLGLTHNLGGMLAPGLKEARELRDARARHAYVIGALDLFGPIDKRRTSSLERTRGVIGLRGAAAIHGNGAYALWMCQRPAGDIETGFALTQNEQAKDISKRHERPLSQLEEQSKANGTKCRSDNPKTDDDLGLGPTLLFEMMMDGRHKEDALVRKVEVDILNHDRKGLNDK